LYALELSVTGRVLMHRFGVRLKTAMTAAGIKNAEDLARKSGIPPQVIRRWLKDEEPHLSARHLLDIARLLHVRVHWLGTGEGPKLRFHATRYTEADMLEAFRSLGERERVIVRDFIGCMLRFMED
jgi:transcriptional regulator with XRE-family HTH domain